MSRIIPSPECLSEFELNDKVSFIAPWGNDRIQGTVVRVYNSRTLYHVEVDGTRYEVTYDDEPRLVEKR